MNRYFTKRRAKKAQPVAKVEELDLTMALPPADDFRTSLIMGSLSKRFSMLRDQDDPHSLIGKASDDSVLAPRRQSRLMDFGYMPGRNLHDIAEVSSIHGDFRPPFANERQNSFISESGYGTDDDSHNGSIMNRARPGEGNVLFGGRQKIYKIPLAGSGSTSSLGGPSGMKGRALYDDDVSMSTFQRWRQEERNRLGDSDYTQTDEVEPSSKVPTSPSLAGGIRRQTSSSTSNTNGRVSTAATSINSQTSSIPSSASAQISSSTTSTTSNSPAMDRTVAKNRRLYEFGLTRDIEDQQSTAISRLNSIQKPRGRVSPPFASSSTISRQAPQELPRASSPTRNFTPSSRLNTSIAVPKAPEVPSPLEQYRNNPLMSALDPNDRGKATATGAFNKPQQFSEQEYLERQMTLRSEQASRMSGNSSNKHDDKISLADSRSDDHSSYAPSNYSVPSRSPTNASTKSPVAQGISIFQKAASLMKAAHAEPEAEDHKSNFFFSRSSDGSYYDQDIPPLNNSTPLSKVETLTSKIRENGFLEQPPVHEHPAFKSKLLPEHPKQTTDTSSGNAFSAFNFSEAPGNEESLSASSAAHARLSGLVRAHLRHGSNASSYYEQDRTSTFEYPPKLPVKSRAESLASLKHLETSTPAESNYSAASNPFDLEDLKHSENNDSGRYSPVSEVDEEIDTSPKGIKAARRRGMSQAPDPEIVPWASHARGPSAETIQEQDALSNEIAKRTRMIQERLEAKRSESIPSVIEERSSAAGPFRGFDILRTRSSRESMKKGTDSPVTKSGRGLTFGASASERPSMDRLRSEDSYNTSIRSRSNSRPAASRSNSRPGTRSGAGKLANMDNIPSMPGSTRTSEDSLPDRKYSNPPPISALNNMGARSRSNSAQSGGRSRSRNGRYKDEMETSDFTPEPESIPEHPAHSMDRGRSSQDTQFPRLQIQTNRSTSGGTGYFDKGLFPHSHQLHSPLSASSQTSSPRLPFQNNMAISPSLSRGQSPAFPVSPVVGVPKAPFMNHGNVATPPVSGNSTPIASYFPGGAPMPANMNRGRSQSRKKIHKMDIGEPRLIATTSVIDTVSLPAGASLKNGMNEIQHSAPPLPSMNPLRRKFNLGGRSSEDSNDDVLTFKSSPYEPLTSASSQPSHNSDGSFKPRHRLRKSSSEGEKLGMMRLRTNQQATASNPSLATPGGIDRISEGGMF
jgi:hypothetical protein